MHEQRAIASMPLYVNVERINNELDGTRYRQR